MKSKDTIRSEARKHRKRINISEIDFDAARDSFFRAIEGEKQDIIAAYWPIESEREFDVLPIIDSIHEKLGMCALPHVHKDTRVLSFVAYYEIEQMETGPYGIHQPNINGEIVIPDIIILPLLAFDQKGRRLGYGGGFYDATLEALENEGHKPLKVGIGYAEQACLFKLPFEEHDHMLDIMITPKNIYDFRMK